MSLEVDQNHVTETLPSFVEQIKEKHGLTEYTLIVKNWLMYATGLCIHLSFHFSRHYFQNFWLLIGK